MSAAKIALEALKQYADPLNWTLDDNGIARVWLEPDSSSKTAYAGFELAKKAITSIEVAKVDSVRDDFKAFYLAANNLLCHIGYEGNIDADHPFVWEAMTKLKSIDGGIYGTQFSNVQVDVHGEQS